MNSDEAELAAATIQRLNQYAEGLCQQLQDARATIALMSDAALERERTMDSYRYALMRVLMCGNYLDALEAAEAALKGTADATD